MECFDVGQDGFHGFLHTPAADSDRAARFAGKALIVPGGSEGNESIPRGLGARFAHEGVTALGLCYWNEPVPK